MIRDAQSGDLGRIMEIEKASFNNPWSFNAFKSAIEDDGPVHFLVWDEDGIGGFIIYSLICGEAEVYDLATAPELRRKGIAKELLAEMLEDADAAFLEVRAGNVPAIGLYEKCGFKVTGERKGYYDDGEDALTMEWNR